MASLLYYPGGPSAKCYVLVFKVSKLYQWVDPSAKVCSYAKFGVVVFKASILDSLGEVHLPKYVHIPSFGVLVFKASLLHYLGGGHRTK